MASQTPFGIESELVIEEKKVGIIYSSRGISDDGQAGRTGQLVANRYSITQSTRIQIIRSLSSVP